MILGVDVGGTFTDAVAIDADGVRTGKAPTTPDDQSIGVMAAVEQALGDRGTETVERFVHGMTVGTNALLEGRTARTALIATAGFSDIEELGRQARPELYRLCAAGPAPIVPAELRVAASERCLPDGVLEPLDADGLRDRLAALPDDVESVAICLLWGFRHPEHEREAARIVTAMLDGVHVSTSHETSAVFREYERCVTTVVDATVSPLLARYLEQLTGRARSAGLPSPEIMLSSGGVVDAQTAARHGSWTVLSGPAGGAVAAAGAARESGAGGAVALDMGGTSCDVSLILDGRVAVTGGREIAGRSLALPMVDVHTVGAGGGSLAWRDAGGALRVGPRSAGARPGPASYGHGGTDPTVTDASLLAGHLDAGSPLAGGIALDRDAAERALSELADELAIALDDAVGGTLRVAAVEMAQAVRVVTVERGIDPRALTLVAFGGAGPLHAAAIAAELGIERIVAPAASGVLSALGLAVSERRRDVVESVLLAGDALTEEAIATAVGRLGERGRAELRAVAAGHRASEPRRAAADAELRATYELRYAGQAFELPVEAGLAPTPDELRAAFDAAHADRYGYADPDAELELVTVRVAAALPGTAPPVAAPAAARRRGTRRARFGDEWHEAVVLGPGSCDVVGPAIVELPGSTLVVPPGWSGVGDATGVTLERRGSRMTTPAGQAPAGGSGGESSPDPIALQVMVGALRSACDEMGAVLVRSAHSANIKERRDASTALFDREGQMVMQAEHIPVHLGAMPSAVAAVLGEPQSPGDAWILNDPYAGGTHLPDITVVSPVFLDGRELLGFAASRAHHADVGAAEPGSMPADSRTLADEGVVIPPTRLAPAGELDRELLDGLTARMRNPAEREADLRAQLAANRAGALRLEELARRMGVDALRAGMAETLDYAERRTRARIAALPDGELTATDVLEAVDGDLELRLRAVVRGDAIELDFSGSAAQHDGNLNCPLAVTLSACYFALRAIADPDVPPCAGAYRPLRVTVPAGCLLNAAPPAAVAAGNVETSSRVADLVLAAFGQALGQGTMNNLTLGNDDFTYYETLGGGQGACADADGPSAVHVAMSNTLNTPIEALELEFPLRAIEYALRRGSGGAGARRGGDGVARELEALAEMRFSLITERRRHAPPGAAGGAPGARGRNLLDGEELPAKVSGTLRPGSRLRIETPGGGGHGRSG